MKEGTAGGDGGFVRADQIDLKSLDEQLERHLTRAWTMEKKKKEEAGDGADHRTGGARQRREDWEIDPAKLVVKGAIARGTFGTVHRGVYDGQDVAGTARHSPCADRAARAAAGHCCLRTHPRRLLFASFISKLLWGVGGGGGHHPP